MGDTHQTCVVIKDDPASAIAKESEGSGDREDRYELDELLVVEGLIDVVAHASQLARYLPIHLC